MRRLAERAAELAAEVGAREAGGAGQVVDVERLEVARVGEVLGAQQVAGGRDEGHAVSIARRSAHPTEGGGCPALSVARAKRGGGGDMPKVLQRESARQGDERANPPGPPPGLDGYTVTS